MTATTKKSTAGVTKKKSVKSRVKPKVKPKAADKASPADTPLNKTRTPAKAASLQTPPAPVTDKNNTAREPEANSAGMTGMSANSTENSRSDKKSGAKSDIKTKSGSKAKSKEALQAEKISKAEIKALEKAASKAKEIEKKAKKAAEKAKEMARNKSKKREKEHKKIKYERRMKREEAVTYFTSLIAGIEKGTVQFKQGKDTVVLNPGDLVDVEIKAETKGREEKVTFEISWLTTSAQDISISSG